MIDTLCYSEIVPPSISAQTNSEDSFNDSRKSPSSSLGIIPDTLNSTPPIGKPLYSAAQNFFHESFFHGMLILERKRSERSNNQFLLLLLDIEELYSAENGVSAIKKTIDVANWVSRDTDIKGWYREHKTIGIIYTGITYVSTESIVQKVKTCLSEELGEQQAGLVDLSYFVFPEDDVDDSDSGTNQYIFYHTLPKNKKKRINDSLTKRSIDILGSLIGITLFSPVMLFAAIAIKLFDKGPIFFKQKRVGLGGQLFNVLKFRTMKVNNDTSAHKEFAKNFINGDHSSNNGEFKIKQDPRITPIGNFLRKTSLDELPQFFNVFMGTMSLVGPRPAVPYEVAEYNSWHKRRVFEVKPGITGVWQINGRSRTTFDEMVRMDIQYINSKSFIQDIMLILKTPLAMLMTKGAY